MEPLVQRSASARDHGLPGLHARAAATKPKAPQGRRYIALYALERPEALESAEFAARRGWAEFTPHVSATVEVYGAIEGGRQP